MTKIKNSLLLWTLILGACSPGILAPQTSSPLIPTPTPFSADPPLDSPTKNPSVPKIIVTLGTPNIGQGPDGNFPDAVLTSDTCGFSWAHPVLEDLTASFDTAIKNLNPQASAFASAFGEDCIYQDGRKVFFAIETDFYIDLPVTDLANFESFGNWISQTMPIVTAMPSDMIEGPQVGFVEYKFTKSVTEILRVRIPISEYENKAKGKMGEELFLAFYSAP